MEACSPPTGGWGRGPPRAGTMADAEEASRDPGAQDENKPTAHGDSLAGSEREELLTDGRMLTWAEYGRADGSPVLFFHGANDSRLDGRLLAGAATGTGVRLICPDRPGYGGPGP